MSQAARSADFAIPIEHILRVGNLVFVAIQTRGGEVKLPSRMLGWREGRFIMLALPFIEKSPAPLREGEQVVVRYVLEGQAYGCRTRVLRVQYLPDPLLFLSFPEEIENVPLRAQRRIPVRLPAVAQWVGEGSPAVPAFGFLRDVSADGAQFALPLPDGAQWVGRRAWVTFSLGTEDIRVQMVVKNHVREGNDQLLGVAFCWSDPAPRNRLITFCRVH